MHLWLLHPIHNFKVLCIALCTASWRKGNGMRHNTCTHIPMARIKVYDHILLRGKLVISVQLCAQEEEEKN